MFFYRLNIVIVVQFCLSLAVCGQDKIHGKIIDEHQEPVYRARIKLKDGQNYTTDFKGNFSILILKRNQNDSLYISAPTLESLKIPIASFQISDTIKIVLKQNARVLNDIVILHKDPISEQFAVEKLEKLDIYLNPSAKGDPLNALSILPSSTNTNETANPAIRGSTSDRSRVYINGLPILNPVRNAQDNGLGNFSLFNTEIISKIYLYPGNPPLIYGNTSAGMIEIETNTKLVEENIQFSTALSNVGFFLNKKIGKKTFVQLYSNIQFPQALFLFNKNSLERLNSFNTIDAGLNFRTQINKRASFNSFNYAIDEGYDILLSRFSFTGDARAFSKRFFSANNFDYVLRKAKVRMAFLADINTSGFDYGVINSSANINRFYGTINQKLFLSKKFNLQYGIDMYSNMNTYEEIVPKFSFFLTPNNPFVEDGSETTRMSYAEVYVYGTYKFNRRLNFATGARSNVILSLSPKPYLSYQLSSTLKVTEKAKLIFGIGNYRSYSTPTFQNHQHFLLSSKQASVDYNYRSAKNFLNLAVYAKNDINQSTNTELRTIGIEFLWRKYIRKNWVVGLSNAFLDQNVLIADNFVPSTNNLKYFFKAQFSYINFKIFSSSLVLTTRPGQNYTPIIGSSFNEEINIFVPTFGEFNSATYDNYFKVDFSINKMFDLRQNAFLVFVNISNVFDRINQASSFYNNDYSEEFFGFLQRRIFYFGCQYRFRVKDKRTIDKLPTHL